MKDYKIVGVKLPTKDHEEFNSLCAKMEMNHSEFASKLVLAGMEMLKAKKVGVPNFIATVRFSINYTEQKLR